MATQANKEEIVRRLLITRQKAASLRTRLRLLREEEAEATIADKVMELDDRIEDLVEAMMADWRGNAQSKIEAIAAANTRIQEAIRKVRDRNRRAQEIVKAVGLIDDVIGIAGAFL